MKHHQTLGIRRVRVARGRRGYAATGTATIVALFCVLGCGGMEDDMARRRPANMNPGSWLMANGSMSGQGVALAAVQNYSTLNPTYPAASIGQVIGIQSDEEGDAQVLGCTVQMSNIAGQRDFSVTPFVDVLLDVSWGVKGGQNHAIMKVGGGVAFSVPADYVRVNAQNLEEAVLVTGSAAPGSLRSNAPPRYSFSIDLSGGQLLPTAFIYRFIDWFAPPSFVADQTLVNNTKAPFIIPPYARALNFGANGAGNANTLTINQFGAGGGIVRADSVVTSSVGLANLTNIPILAETAYLSLQDPTAADLPNGFYTFDFELGL